MGLLDDFKMPGMDTPEGQGLLSAAFSLMSAQKRPGQKGAFAGALGDAGQQYLQATNSSRDQMQRRKYLDAQMEAQQMQLEAVRKAQADKGKREAYMRSLFTPQGPAQAMSDGRGPTMQNAQRLGQMPQIDPRQVLSESGPEGLQEFLKINSALNPKAPEPIKLGQTDRLVDPTNYRELVGAVQKPEVIDYNKPFLPDGTPNKAYQDYSLSKADRGATRIGMPKIDIKMGDSVAGQVGPIGSASRTKAEGAVTMFDSADRIQKALDSGKVSAGPGSSTIQTVKQLVQKVGGGNDEGIRQTQQVIRSLSKMAVEARKQLAGQGQVTESEARAVEKADGGNIDDLTTGELQDLVTLTKRAAHFTAKGHQEFLSTMQQNDGTRGAAPFYNVRGMDALLQHQPKLPQIGGNSGWSIQKE